MIALCNLGNLATPSCVLVLVCIIVMLQWYIMRVPRSTFSPNLFSPVDHEDRLDDQRARCAVIASCSISFRELH